jgi:hypothetical protein
MYITGYNLFVSMYNDTIANNNYDFELEEVRIEYYLKLTEPIFPIYYVLLLIKKPILVNIKYYYLYDTL